MISPPQPNETTANSDANSQAVSTPPPGRDRVPSNSDSSDRPNRLFLDRQEQEVKQPGAPVDYDPGKPRTSPLQWLYDLPIGRKILLIAGTSFVSILALIGIVEALTSEGLREQLLKQAQSEVALTEINYYIKMNQMGFGFRGQADNTAIIAAAKAKSLTPALQGQVKRILQNEVKARKMEYATLVDREMRIIVNANQDRQGEVFNPNNLVKEIFSDPRQTKATAIVSWAELAKEAPPLPSGFDNQEALIRYTVTPVRDPASKAIIGALVSGDIVNGKVPIVQGTLKAFGGGYSAVYFRKPSGEFTLATALDKGSVTDLEKAQPNVALPNSALLTMALAAKGKPVNEQQEVVGQDYALAAKTLPNITKEEASGPVPLPTGGEPVAILVRGTPRAELNALLQQSLISQLMLGALVVGINVGLALLIGRAISQPVRKLQQSARAFSTGDRQARAEVLGRDEVGQLSTTFNELADNVVANQEAVQRQEELRLQEQEQALRQQTENAEEQRLAAEKLQKRALELLIEVDPVSRGDLTIRANVTEDEIGTVADSYNATIGSLRRIVAQVQTAARQMAETTSTSEVSAQGLSVEALRQTEEINAALDQLQGMSKTIREVAASAEQAEAAVQQANQTVSEGDVAMDRTVKGILAIQETVTETSKKVKRLGSSSQEISKVVKLIGRFAAQTNLLALNASIEATRAGEEGRGFAVVANEVRSLARQSAAATADITKIVANIQTETNEVVAAMETGTEQVVTGTKLVDETRRSLNKITAVSTQIGALVEAIAQATVTQSQASEEVTQTMNDVAAIAGKTSTEANQVSASFKNLLSVAQELQTSAGQFKVS